MTDNARIDEDADSLWEALLPHMQVSAHADGSHSAYADKILALDLIRDALARRSIQEQPEAVDDGWSELHDRPEIPARNPRVVKVLNASAPPPIAGAGWKLMPPEPTEEMYSPAEAATTFGNFIRFGDFYHSYKAMFAAAPASPVPDNTDARGARDDWRPVETLRDDGTTVTLRTTIQPSINARWGVSSLSEDGGEEGWIDANGFWVLEEGETVIGWRPIIPGTDASAVIEQLREAFMEGRRGYTPATIFSNSDRMEREWRESDTCRALDLVKAPKP